MKAPDPSFRPVPEQMEILRRHAVDLLPEEELVEKLERSRRIGRPLLVKCGYDPTRPDLHIGHAVTLRKLRDFRRLGHRVVFLIGDFTALIGDPSGRSTTRPALTPLEVAANAATFADQVALVLGSDFELRYNSEWLGGFKFDDVIRLAARYPVARMLEREDFRQRLAEGRSIAMHELLYPLAQGYDSVALASDVELGGTDQRFNLLVGRDIQREHGLEPQVILTTPLLEGTDGVQKMSKSLDNAIGFLDPPDEKFGRTMSIPDGMIAKWWRFAVDSTDAEVEAAERGLERGDNPRDWKRSLARRIVAEYDGEDAAARAEARFEALFVRHETPTDAPERTVAIDAADAALSWVLREAELAGSASEGRRLVAQGGVTVDGAKVEDPEHRLAAGSTVLIQVGKRRFARVTLDRLS